jgi:glutamine synthetase
MRFVRHTFRDHQRIIFDGNGYSDEWEAEAERRGLANLRTTPDALGALVDPDNIALLERYGVLTEPECHARYVAKAEQYAKLINIEANTMCHMTRHMYIPALSEYSGNLATSVATKAELGIVSAAEKEIIQRITRGIDEIYRLTAELEAAAKNAGSKTNPTEQDALYRDEVIPVMAELRSVVDEMETICGGDYWPVPSYNDILFYV